MYLTAYNNKRKSMSRIFDQISDLHQAIMRDEGREREKVRDTSIILRIIKIYDHGPVLPLCFCQNTLNYTFTSVHKML